MFNNFTWQEIAMVAGAFLLSLAGAVFGTIKLAGRALWAYVREREAEMREDIDRAQATADNASRDLAAFKTEVAEEYSPTRDAVDRLHERVEDGFSAINQRLDQFLQSLAGTPRRK